METTITAIQEARYIVGDDKPKEEALAEVWESIKQVLADVDTQNSAVPVEIAVRMPTSDMAMEQNYEIQSMLDDLENALAEDSEARRMFKELSEKLIVNNVGSKDEIEE